jgi:hypothetical protein
MKKITLLSAILIIGLISCKKEDPKTNKQFVNYEVECIDCVVYLEDSKWNYTNEMERSKNQHFNVQGKFHYGFENTNLDSIRVKLYVGTFSPYQEVKLNVYTNDGIRYEIVDRLGFDSRGLSDKLEKSYTLKIKK